MQRLQPLLKIARVAEQSAVSEFMQHQQQQQQLEMQLTQLEEYKNEYYQKYINTAQAGVLGQSLLSYQNFLAKLDTAIREQKQRVIQAQEYCKIKKTQWLEKRQQVKVYENLLEQAHKKQLQKQLKQEQKENDAFRKRQ